MGLEKYRKKRNPERTPEPPGTLGRDSGELHFVVQKHAASRLHYDFRLELDGVLKSWAVPKGPSLDPDDKRLAIMVEDHPIEYGTFEGTIPAGNYGAGGVIVWDAGLYTEAGGTGPQARRKLREGLRKGRLSIVLAGRKLNGRFSLVRLQGREDNAWLLIKAEDEHASSADVLRQDSSVQSGRALEDLPGAPHARPAAGTAMPSGLEPMLATLVQEPFDREGWLFEVKWDGYRMLAYLDGGRVRIVSRGQKEYAAIYPRIAGQLGRIGHQAILDGEIVVLGPNGKPDFGGLQRFQDTGEGDLVYMVFDCLFADGRDLMGLPLTERRAVLKPLLGHLEQVQLSEAVPREGKAFFKAAQEQALEGIMAKDGASLYLPGRRAKSWLKVKTHARQEAVIGGYTEGRGARRHLGALVLGVREGHALRYIGHTGTGFDVPTQERLLESLQPLETAQSPFTGTFPVNAPVHWVRPERVCEVRFQEWTVDGRMRLPVFVGMRPDKPSPEVTRERPALEITHPDKVFWPKEGLTKGDLAHYYQDVAPLLLPYLKDRPESLNRTPDGILRPGFFQKHLEQHPPWVRTLRIRSESKERSLDYLVCDDLDTLLYMVNLGCVELNPWHSRAADLDRPDYALLDLDAKTTDFQAIVKVARETGRLLEELGIPSVPKTSGKTGLHVCIPLGARYGFEQVKGLAELLVNLVHQRLPKLTSLVRDPDKREGLVYLDFLQNRIGQTMASPYCVRPVAGACVSTPLDWREVEPGLDPRAFTLKTAPARFARTGDLWQPVLGPGIDLKTVLKRVASLSHGASR